MSHNLFGFTVDGQDGGEQATINRANKDSYTTVGDRVGQHGWQRGTVTDRIQGRVHRSKVLKASDHPLQPYCSLVWWVEYDILVEPTPGTLGHWPAATATPTYQYYTRNLHSNSGANWSNQILGKPDIPSSVINPLKDYTIV